MAFLMKRHDLRPYIPVQFFQPDGETPLDLSAALAALIADILVGSTGIRGRDVTFRMAPICAGVILLSVSAAPGRNWHSS